MLCCPVTYCVFKRPCVPTCNKFLRFSPPSAPFPRPASLRSSAAAAAARLRRSAARLFSFRSRSGAQRSARRRSLAVAAPVAPRSDRTTRLIFDARRALIAARASRERGRLSRDSGHRRDWATVGGGQVACAVHPSVRPSVRV